MKTWYSRSIGILEGAVTVQNQLPRVKRNIVARCGRNWPRAWYSLGLFVLITIFAWIATGCNGEDYPQSPRFDGPIVDSPTPLNPGEEVGISLTISRAAGATVSYVWKVDLGGGEIIKGQGTPAITYRAPDVPGIYIIGVEVSWNDHSEERTEFVEVEAENIEVEVEEEPPSTLIPTSPSPDTPTPTSAVTPTSAATPTSSPSKTTPRSTTIKPPGLIAPGTGSDVKGGRPELQWGGTVLPTGHFFVVRLQHTGSDSVLISPELNVNYWVPPLPAEKYGGWSWEVQVVKRTAQGVAVVTTSDKWEFYFDPFSGAGGGGESPVPTPSD